MVEGLHVNGQMRLVFIVVVSRCSLIMILSKTNMGFHGEPFMVVSKGNIRYSMGRSGLPAVTVFRKMVVVAGWKNLRTEGFYA